MAKRIGDMKPFGLSYLVLQIGNASMLHFGVIRIGFWVDCIAKLGIETTGQRTRSTKS
jgi:hypothetical protein